MDIKEERWSYVEGFDGRYKSQKILTNTQEPATKNEYQAYAYDKVINLYLWSEEDYNALVKLWDRESEWNPHAHNKNSGAHGIPQSLPADKMASEGEDYYTNGYTQINWGLKYIKERYGSPLAAWMHSERKGWYSKNYIRRYYGRFAYYV